MRRSRKCTLGASPSGKAQGFDPCIPRFDKFVGNKFDRPEADPGGAEDTTAWVQEVEQQGAILIARSATQRAEGRMSGVILAPVEVGCARDELLIAQ